MADFEIQSLEQYEQKITDAPKITFIRKSENAEADEATHTAINSKIFKSLSDLGGKDSAETMSKISHYKHSLSKNTILYSLIQKREERKKALSEI